MWRRRRNKYGAKRRTVDNITFASLREAARYQKLKLLLAAGEIQDLELQPAFPLVVLEAYRAGPRVMTEVGQYIADFMYTVCATGEIVVEDAKGVRTPLYRLKKKLVQAIHGLSVTEV
jgi:hypothetical protein